jgi:hypothetical protein
VGQSAILKAKGADEVLLPYTLIGNHLANLVTDTCR